MKRRTLSVVAVFVLLAVTSPAQAMYHTRLGRFIQRDPGPGGIGAVARVGLAGPIAGGGYAQRDPRHLELGVLNQLDVGGRITDNQFIPHGIADGVYHDGMHLYAYALANPVNYLDSFGLKAKQCLAAKIP